jgi:hypothetical protein
MSKQEMIRRASQSIAECARFIDREEKRDPSLRPIDVQQTLSFYKSHKASMEAQIQELIAA